jgi:hypothetical protein
MVSQFDVSSAIDRRIVFNLTGKKIDPKETFDDEIQLKSITLEKAS